MSNPELVRVANTVFAQFEPDNLYNVTDATKISLSDKSIDFFYTGRRTTAIWGTHDTFKYQNNHECKTSEECRAKYNNLVACLKQLSQ